MSGLTLTELQYSNDRKGPWRLYVYNPNGYHNGGQYFSRRLRYPDEEITVSAAKELCDRAELEDREVRVTDGGDMLVYHSKGGKVLYGHSFWGDIAK